MADRPKHFSLFFSTAGASPETVWRPAVDIYRTRTGGWLLKFDLAGVRLEDLELSIHGPYITIAGLRRDFLLEEGCSYYSMEIAYSRFQRTVELPCQIGDAHYSLDYRDGILVVRLEHDKE